MHTSGCITIASFSGLVVINCLSIESKSENQLANQKIRCFVWKNKILSSVSRIQQNFGRLAPVIKLKISSELSPQITRLFSFTAMYFFSSFITLYCTIFNPSFICSPFCLFHFHSHYSLFFCLELFVFIYFGFFFIHSFSVSTMESHAVHAIFEYLENSMCWKSKNMYNNIFHFDAVWENVPDNVNISISQTLHTYKL